MSINQPALLMIAAAIISLLLSLYAWKNKQNSAGIYLFLLLASASIWSFFYGMEILTTNVQNMKLYLFISYFGITSLSAFWLLFAARYSGVDIWISPFSIVIIFIIPVLTIIMVGTNHIHHLFYTSVNVGDLDGYTYLKLESGPFWYINIIYSHILFVLGFILFIRLYYKVDNKQRIHILYFIGGAALPYFVNVLYVLGFRPYGFLDLTPVAFIIMGLIISFGVFTIKLFDINPLAVDLFFKNTQDVIIVRNNKGKIVNANPAAQALLETVSSTEIFKETNRNEKYLEVNDSYDFHEITEIKIYQKIYEKTNTKIVSSNGKDIGTLTILREISKAKEAQEEIKKLASLQHLLMKMASKYINLRIEDMEDGIQQSLCEMGIFAEADRAYIFDYDWEKKIGRNTYEWCADGIGKEIDYLQEIPFSALPEWIEAHTIGKSLIVPDIFILSKEDPLRKILEPRGIKSLITIPIMYKNHCHGFIGFDFVKKYHFITENENTLLSVYAEILVNLRKRAQLEKSWIEEKENANAANKAKSEFLANMSHEIRTPMNSILGFAEVILNTTNDAKQKSYLNTILESGKTLLSLINDILDLSKIESGRLEISPEPTDLKVMIQEMENLFCHKMKEKNIDFIIEIDEEFPKAIIIDDLRIRQILLNLVGNAVKFTNEGFVKIKVDVLQKKSETINFEIKVIDTGIGISGNNYQYLFESFSQQSGQNSRKYGGTGLGLAITKRLVELMNGNISIESELGKGSCFTVSFNDIIKSEEIVTAKTEDYTWTEKNISFKGSKILVVDDILHNRILALTYLEKYDLTLIEAENGEEAIKKAKLYLPDLIFMDIRMPGIDGFEATKIIRSNEKTANIPIIALTASTMQNDLEQVGKIFDGYIPKPVQKKALLLEMIKHLPFEEFITEEQKLTDIIIIRTDEPEHFEITENLKNQFKIEFSDELVNQTDFMIVDELNTMIVKLENFATKNNIIQLKNKTKDLKTYIDEFDFDNIQGSLSAIRKMFE